MPTRLEETIEMRVPLHLKAIAAAWLLLAALVPAVTFGQAADPLDPAHNVSLPCEALSTPGLVPRSARNLAHLANVCGFVGTDIEFQSRTASDGLHDYAFVGTMGAGLQIFDITNPARPMEAGGYEDPGWEDDIQIWGDLAVIGVDPVEVTPKTSACLMQYSAVDGGIDILSLHFDAATARFSTELLGCVPNLAGGGAHNAQIHPSGQYVVMLNPRGDGSIDIVDLRDGQMRHTYRFVQTGSLTSASCPSSGVTFTCVSIGRGGNWSPHDLHFSRDGKTAYIAAVGDDTVILDVSQVLAGKARIIGIAPNRIDAVDNPNNVAISHQSDITADGKLLVVTDERGGGLTQTACNSDPNGIIGGAHFWAIAPITGRPETANASPANPVKLGIWVYPNPGLLLDPLEPTLAAIGRTERACTIHVFRIGGNGSASPGETYPGLDGVSRLPARQLTTAHYGGGVWWMDFSAPASGADGIAEDPRSTWANTRGWNVMPGADTWSAKEYKGYIYASDIARGFDVYSFTSCVDAGCVVRPTNTPGSVGGGGKLEQDFATFTILRGSAPGGEAQFGMDIRYLLGGATPTGSLTFQDRALNRKVQATAIDSLTITGSRATITGRATVDGVPGVSFALDVEDLGQAGADTFRIVLADGYAAAGVLTKGNITVQGSGLLGS
jgi:LVIVD repeat-containing protein